MSQRICSAEGCDRAALCRHMCQKHYQAWRRANPEEADGTDARRRPIASCAIEECDRRATSRGWCRLHYLRWYRTGDPLTPTAREIRAAQPVAGPVCSIDGCGSEAKARGWCSRHLTRFYRHGSPTARVKGEIVDGAACCARCGTAVPTSVWRTYCQPCEARVQVEYLAKNPRAKPTIRWDAVCEICGTPFSADNRQRFTCSTACKRKRDNRENMKHVHRRRALMRSEDADSIRPREIYERDGWICQLCGDPLAFQEKAPHPDTPSIDHVIPLARGGAHTRANVQAAHLLCNTRKGVTTPEVLSR